MNIARKEKGEGLKEDLGVNREAGKIERYGQREVDYT